MKHQRRRTLTTYFLSFLPGAGFMYRGYMKRGFSYLAAFFTLIALVETIGIGLLQVIPILLWFYAFFDQINTLSDVMEERKKIEDKNMFLPFFKKCNLTNIVNNYRLIGGGCVFLGTIYFMRVFEKTICLFAPAVIRDEIETFMYYVPQMLVSVLFIYVGVRLFQGNKHLVHLLHKIEALSSKEEKKQQSITETNVVYYIKENKELFEHKQQMTFEKNEFHELAIHEPETKDMNRI